MPIGQLVMIASGVEGQYPTRDHRLVQIMKKRVDSFSILLGGVMDIELDEMVDDSERWRNDVIEHAKASLRRDAVTLRASGG